MTVVSIVVFDCSHHRRWSCFLCRSHFVSPSPTIVFMHSLSSFCKCRGHRQRCYFDSSSVRLFSALHPPSSIPPCMCSVVGCLYQMFILPLLFIFQTKPCRFFDFTSNRLHPYACTFTELLSHPSSMHLSTAQQLSFTHLSTTHLSFYHFSGPYDVTPRL